jgi:hypothetical protein
MKKLFLVLVVLSVGSALIADEFDDLLSEYEVLDAELGIDNVNPDGAGAPDLNYVSRKDRVYNVGDKVLQSKPVQIAGQGGYAAGSYIGGAIGKALSKEAEKELKAMEALRDKQRKEFYQRIGAEGLDLRSVQAFEAQQEAQYRALEAQILAPFMELQSDAEKLKAQREAEFNRIFFENMQNNPAAIGAYYLLNQKEGTAKAQAFRDQQRRQLEKYLGVPEGLNLFDTDALGKDRKSAIDALEKSGEDLLMRIIGLK